MIIFDYGNLSLNINTEIIMKVREIISCLETFAPLYLQESYDNSGLQIGDPDQELESVLITLDINESVIDEAINSGSGMIISHHPLVFKPVKRLSARDEVERCILNAIKNDIAIYAVHTNIDNASGGLNFALAEALGIRDTKILMPGAGRLNKIITFCPSDSLKIVTEAMFRAGAGHIGRYDMCSFQVLGSGTFRALEGSNPFLGEINRMHTEDEIRVEMVVPIDFTNGVIEAMKRAHPYEEVAYDVISLVNDDPHVGAGVYGSLSEPVNGRDFLEHIKNVLNINLIRHTRLPEKRISQVGVCGGSGAFLTNRAYELNLDALVTADVKYHQFLEAAERILLVDAGHYETEIVVTRLICDEIQKKFPNFACQISRNCTNPIKYS